MRPNADDPAIVKHNDAVGRADSTRPLGHHKNGHILRLLPESLTQRRICGEIQRAGTVIQNQNLRRADQRAGNCQPLALPAGQIAPALLDHSIEPLRELAYKFGGLCD